MTAAQTDQSSCSSSYSSPPPLPKEQSLHMDTFNNENSSSILSHDNEIKEEKRGCFNNPFHLFLHRTKVLYSQLTTSEISGSLGDLGTLIPLLVTMSRERSVLLAPALFFAGLANIITGYVWDVPMCVQPMKSIAAVAISEGLNRESVTTAGILTGAMIFVIGLSNFIEVVNVIVPCPVVSGLQMGVGLRLASRGMRDVQSLGWVDNYDCILLAVICSAFCLYWLREPIVNSVQEQRLVSDDNNRACILFRKMRKLFTPKHQHPVGIYLFMIGVLFAIIELSTVDPNNTEYDLPLTFFGAPVAVWAMESVTSADWETGLLEGAIPQIPLTTLNSVISVCCLAHSLYPEKRRNHTTTSSSTDAVIGRREVSMSVGLMNLVMCPFGAMPNCHGAGGLAGQHRLGARHGASVVFLGVAKVFLAVFFGKSALTLLDALPTAVLGVMLAIAGQELTTTGFGLLVSSVDEDERLSSFSSSSGGDNDDDDVDSREEREKRRKHLRKQLLRKKTVIATITCAVIVALGKTHYGALSGWVAHMIYGDGTTDFIRWCRIKLDRYRGRRNNIDDDCHFGNEGRECDEAVNCVEKGQVQRVSGGSTSSEGEEK